jgi:putative ABC transport system ATP-binding protein
VTLGLERNRFTAIMGPSGSGKSTLLQPAAGLDRPSSGSVVLDGEDLSGLGELALTRLRRERIGFAFQGFNLLPALTAEQNVALPLRLARRRAKRAEVRSVLERVRLESRRRHRPAELSGGEQQRVAIARAPITRPAVIYAAALTADLCRPMLSSPSRITWAGTTPGASRSRLWWVAWSAISPSAIRPIRRLASWARPCSPAAARSPAR